MDIGVVFPQTEIGTDSSAIRTFAERVEGLGYSHILVYDHVLGIHPEHPEYRAGYDISHQFHEPFVLLSHLAAVTSAVRCITGVLVLPQRGTATVAKQSATLDLLSEGRVTLGVGVGWNKPELEELGYDFSTRGRRIEEQIALLRALWTEEVVDYDGEYESITRAGINPLPMQRPIPIWIGGDAEPVLERVGRLADGWLPRADPATVRRQLEIIAEAATTVGRDPGSIDIVPRIDLPSDREAAIEAVATWTELGVEELSVNTMGQGFDRPSQHVDALEGVRDWFDAEGNL